MMNRGFYKFRKKEQEPKKVKFDIMVGEKYINTLTMTYKECETVSLESIKNFIETKYPATLKNKEYQIYI